MLTMLTAVGEMERDLLVERTQAGLERAKQQRKTLGRLNKTTPAQRKEILAKHIAGISISELSRQYGLSRISIARIAKQTIPETATPQPAICFIWFQLEMFPYWKFLCRFFLQLHMQQQF